MKTNEFTGTMDARRKRSGCWTCAVTILLGLMICLGWAATQAAAQTGDETGVTTFRTSSSKGVYEISPLIVGTYTITASAPGFDILKQEGVVLNENQVFGFNPVLKVGNQHETVTVTGAPPEMDTANAVLGATISSDEFMSLPILVSGNQQRDITAFSNYLPGAQAGSRSSLFSGTASRVEEVYLDGLPLTTISQIGDNRPIFNLVPSEGIGQVGALTSGQSVEYQGAGSVNYSMKTGGNKYHGTVADFVRNTEFDTWGFTAIAATQKELVNGVVTTVPVGKPIDHQNEFTFAVGGPISIPHLFSGHDKLFFYSAYDKVHTRSAPSYATASIPTTLMQQGNFSELLTANGGPGYVIYDPTTLTACTANSTNGPCRYAYGQTAGTAKGPAGNPAGTPTNIIPVGEISPISQTMQSFLPAPSVSGIQNNYLGGEPNGYDSWLYSGRIDYTISPKQTLSATVTGGNRHAVPYTSTTTVIPPPYLGTTASIVAGHWADLSDSYTITPNLVNQFKFGFSNFGGPPLQNITQGVKNWEAANMGINFSGVPADGQAVTEFPTNIFAGSNAQSEWGEAGSGVTATTVSETYTAVDNLLWIKGKHAMTLGIQFQWLEENASSYDGPTSSLTFNWSTNETAGVSGSSYTGSTGYSYASFLLGAVSSTGITLQPFSVLGGRYRPIAPYFADDYKVTSKLTLNLGLRWDYIPTYNEVQNRFSFLNPYGSNPVTGNGGVLEFAGSAGGVGVSCGCNSPVNNYKKNWGPRVGFDYEINSKTVIRGAFSTVYSHAGGTGGAGGAYNGPGQLGFTSSPAYNDSAAGASAGPAFYLNTSATFTSLGIANNNFGGSGYTVPAITAPGAVSQTLNVGNTVNSSGAFVTASGAPGYPDPYIAGRAPEFNFWNFGIQREITPDIVATVNYFLAGASNMRGRQAGQIDPAYYAAGIWGEAHGLGNVLTAAATPTGLANANTAAAAVGLPAIILPYSTFGTAAATSAGAGKATIAQALTWMPQFSGTTDTWPNIANVTYNSLQVSVAKRMSKGLALNLNYTYSKQLDDTGTMRSGFAIPGSAILSGKSWAQNRIERSWSTNSVPHALSIYGLYHIPSGGENAILRAVAGGWTLSGLGTYYSGVPLLPTASSCNSTFEPNTGTCMPDLNPAFTGKNIRQNGSWGKGITATNFSAISYINGYVGNANQGSCGTAVGPFCNSGNFMIGDAPRTAPFQLRNPGVPNLNMGLRRAFNLNRSDRIQFVIAADCQNVANKVTFSGINVGVDSATFGTVASATSNTGSRDFQFSGRLNF